MSYMRLFQSFFLIFFIQYFCKKNANNFDIKLWNYDDDDKKNSIL